MEYIFYNANISLIISENNLLQWAVGVAKAISGRHLGFPCSTVPMRAPIGRPMP